MALHSRLKRVEEQIREEIANIILKEIKDPRIGLTSVNHVHVSKDLRFAKVYVSSLERDNISTDQTVQILTRARKFIRKLLGERVVLKYLPDLEFIHDDTMKRADRINTLLNDLDREREKKEVP